MTSEDMGPIEKKLLDNAFSGRRIQESPLWNSPDVEFLKVELTQHTVDRFNEWQNQCYERAVAKQKAEYENPSLHMVESWELGYPYMGASGGGFTIEVTPTSIGQVVKCRYDYLNEKIDLTEYDLW